MKKILALSVFNLLLSTSTFATQINYTRIQCTNFDNLISIILKYDGGPTDIILEAQMSQGNFLDEFRSIKNKIQITKLKVGYTENQSEIMYYNDNFELITRFNVQTMPLAVTNDQPELMPGFLTTKNILGKFKKSLFFCSEQSSPTQPKI